MKKYCNILLLSLIGLTCYGEDKGFKFNYPQNTNINFIVFIGDSSRNYNSTNNIGTNHNFVLSLNSGKYIAVAATDGIDISDLSNEVYSHPKLKLTHAPNHSIIVSVTPITNQILWIQKSTNLITWVNFTTNNVFMEDANLPQCFYRITVYD